MQLGVATHFEQGWGTEWLAKAKAVGVDLIRDEQGWGKIETSSGVYNFPASQSNYLTMAAGEGIPALLVFTSGNALYDSGYTPYTAEGRQAYANYIVAVLRKYGPEVKEIEVWNEFNGNYSGPGVSDKSASYTQLLKTVWDTVKPLFPDVKVLGGSTNMVGAGALESLFKLGALNYMDGVVVHPYRNNPEHVDDELTHLQDLMAKYGAVKPIYATEMSNNFANAADAPAWMVKMVTLLSSAHVAEADWYSLVDEPWFQNMGLYTQGGVAKPAAAAFSFMQTLLDKGDAVRVNPDDDLTLVYRFGTDTYVLWSVGQKVSFAAGSHVYNATGEEISPPATLGMTPIVVTGGYALGDTNVVADSLMQFNEGDWQYFAKAKTGVLTALENIDWDWTSYLGNKWTNPLRVNADAVTPFGDAANPIQVVERFVSDRAQTIKINATWNTGTGDGVDLHILVNNVEIMAKVFQGAFALDGYTVTLKAGDTLDFALGPNQTFGGDDSNRRITLYRVDALTGDAVYTQPAASNTGSTVIAAEINPAGASPATGLTLTGGAGADTLVGGDKDDLFSGGLGRNSFNGGAGFDTVTYADATAGVQIKLGAAGFQKMDDGRADQFVSIEGVIGSAYNDTFNGSDVSEAFCGGAGDDIFKVSGGSDLIDGGTGFDTVTFASYKAGVNVSLASSANQALGGSDTVRLASIEQLIGSDFADRLAASDAGNTLSGGVGDDVIIGGAGADTLTGGGGADTLTGGAGSDTFVFTAITDSKTTAADKILDFSHAEGDRIDLSAIDANTKVSGNQAFAIANSFTKSAGQMVLTAESGGYYLEGDVNGDGAVDFGLHIVTHTPLAAADFYL